MAKKKERYLDRIELLQGTRDLLILQTLQWGRQSGYGISQAIRTSSSDALRVDTFDWRSAPGGATSCG